MHEIRGLGARDWDQWRPLWRGYLDFYRAELSHATTRATFDRLSGPEDAMFGLIAIGEDGEGAGLIHCIVHPTTWSQRPSCYLEDLFVAPSARGSRLGGDLLKEAKAASDARGADRLYWHTQEYNGRARSLYDQVGRLTPFIVYEM